uniref:BPTI/Kunitz domain-containing protein-like n=1 Tax=Euleptes europaea TaxID=460621 RepID=UPI0025421A76|nr:BPTI/Kunitz domain-containing protein-like [Euleptes europaea]
MGLKVLFLGLLLLSDELLAQIGRGRCSLPLDTGRCKASYIRYYYDKKSNKCTEFVYKGFKGNRNRFDTEEECQLFCGKKGDCMLPPDLGRSLASYIKYHYDQTSDKCIECVDGGCEGDNIWYNTEEECQLFCGKPAALRGTVKDRRTEEAAPVMPTLSSDMQKEKQYAET